MSLPPEADISYSGNLLPFLFRAEPAFSCPRRKEQRSSPETGSFWKTGHEVSGPRGCPQPSCVSGGGCRLLPQRPRPGPPAGPKQGRWAVGGGGHAMRAEEAEAHPVRRAWRGGASGCAGPRGPPPETPSQGGAGGGVGGSRWGAEGAPCCGWVGASPLGWGPGLIRNAGAPDLGLGAMPGEGSEDPGGSWDREGTLDGCWLGGAEWTSGLTPAGRATRVCTGGPCSPCGSGGPRLAWSVGNRGGAPRSHL